MSEEGIRANWRAAIMPENGERPIYGRLSRVGKRMAEVRVEHNLPAGHRCSLALMLPKNTPEEPGQFIEGRGVVAISVLSSAHFHIRIDLHEFKGNGEALLDERIAWHRQVWRN